MRSILSAVVLSVSLASGCAATYNQGQRTESFRDYHDVTMKQLSVGAVRAITKLNFGVTSTSTPVDGMTVISAEGANNAVFRFSGPSKLTVTLIEPEPGRVTVEATAFQGGEMVRNGVTRRILEDFYSRLDETLEGETR